MAALPGPQQSVSVGGGYSPTYAPNGATIAGPHIGLEEKLVMAEIDLSDIQRAKVLVDGAGHSARPEVLRLSLDRTPRTGWADD
jgi:aliphatic nitrilase